jgi:hypothetical protein
MYLRCQNKQQSTINYIHMTSNKTHTKCQETIYIKRQTEMSSLELLHKPWLHLARVLQFIMQAALLLIKMGTTGILPIVEFMNIKMGTQ